MITELSAYSQQKDSEQAWLGLVPKHWQVLANRGVFSEVKERGFRDAEMLSVTIGRGILRQSDLLKETSKKDSSNLDKSKYKLVRPRDLAYNKMRAWQGAIGVSKFTGIISPAYVVMRPHIASVVPRYFHFLYRTPAFAKEAERWSYGITSDMWSLRPEHFKMIYTLVPPPDEQELIVRFLDWASVKLGKAIVAKRKVIGLLEEQKQAIIHRAVTRGLDDTVSLKPSGFEWLGDVPEHWEIMRIKNLLSGIDYGTSENARGEGHIRVLNMGHIKSGRVQIPANGSLRAMPIGLELRSHDLLFNRTNSPELVGKVGIFLGTEADQVTFASYLVRLRPKADHNPFWLNYVLNSMGFWHYARRQAFVSLHQANLNSTRYSQMSIPVPPASEQQLIAEALRAETASFDNAISANEHEIELIREYRTRLIADVVTGKLDVRKFAQTLPADVAEEAAELTSSELGDDEFTDSDDELADELAGEPA